MQSSSGGGATCCDWSFAFDLFLLLELSDGPHFRQIIDCRSELPLRTRITSSGWQNKTAQLSLESTEPAGSVLQFTVIVVSRRQSCHAGTHRLPSGTAISVAISSASFQLVSDPEERFPHHDACAIMLDLHESVILVGRYSLGSS